LKSHKMFVVFLGAKGWLPGIWLSSGMLRYVVW
jgi:hypothetical protein